VADDQAARAVPAVVALPAEIDVTNCDQVHDQLIAAFEPGAGIVIADLTSTVFCDSSGVHAIMRAYERAAARDIQLWLAVTQTGSVRRVLQLTGVGRLMPVYPSLQEAMSAA
jgi:anti-sigma B factor antagonist